MGSRTPKHSDRSLVAFGVEAPEAQALLRVVNLRKTYTRGGVFARSGSRIEALRGINLEVRSGASVALVGASGSGKSTLARCLACLEKPDSGEIWFAGNDLAAGPDSAHGCDRRQIQLIFQDPAWALNPRFTAAEIVSEPLRFAGVDKETDRRERALALMQRVGLPPEAGNRPPAGLSGGQRRRLTIARALALEPRVLILDEALAGLDLSTQAQMANLLMDLREVRALTYLWILHDLRLAARLASEVAVMENGRIVEVRSGPDLFANLPSRAARIVPGAAAEGQF